ncbi:MAG: hypothetical protein RR420_00775 [Anaerovoracaceae bacterium]
MPIILKKIYKISGNYTDEQKIIYKEIIDDFRIRMKDEDPDKNILNNKMYQYEDDVIIALINMAVKDVNSGIPMTNYTIETIHNTIDRSILLLGAMIFALQREGIFELRNQIDFNDSGLSIAMYNKSPMYQSWYGNVLQEYMMAKQGIKRGAIVNSEDSGFVGISSEFATHYYNY